MNSLKSIPNSAHVKSVVSVHPSLTTYTYVFVRHDAAKKSFQSPYDGPCSVVKRNENTFTIDMNDRETIISIARLKSVFLEVFNFFSTTPIQQLPVPQHSTKES